MKNKPFKLALTIVIVGALVFGASFAKATTNEEMIKMLQSLIQMLMQMVAQLQAQLAQKLTTTTTIPILQQTCDSICEAKRYQSGNCIGSSSEGVSPTCPVGDINIGQTTGCSKAEAPSAIGMPTCCCSNKIKYSCTTAIGTLLTNWYSTCIPDTNGTFNSLEECQKICGATSGCTDSDGGKNYNVKGTVIYGSQTYTDSCDYCTGYCNPITGNCPPVTCGAVKEYYCENGVMKYETHVCETGTTCQDGACKSTTTASITVLSPNGGEKFSIGQTLPISFITTLTDKQTSGITLQLYKKTTDSFGKMYTRDIVKNWMNGSPYQWTIPNTITTGEYYIYATVENLRDVPVKEVYDFSDASFTIMAGPTTTCTDSDEGKNYYIKGTTKDEYQYIDSCWDPSGSGKAVSYSPYLMEYYCIENRVAGDMISCPTDYTCQDGACKQVSSTLKPDLIIPTQTGIVLSSPGTNPKVGDPYAYFDVTIKNIGTATATPTSIIYGGLDIVCSLNNYPTGFSDSNMVLGVMFTNPLAPNSTVTSYRATTGADSSILKSAGNKLIYCTVDPYNKISESNENNNNYQFYITVDPSNITCTDSDGGMNIYVKGTASRGTVAKTDECTQRVWNGQAYQYNVVNLCSGDGCYVDEAVCLSDGTVGKGGSGQTDHQCPSGYTCQDGACTTSTTACTDSDGGNNIYTKGTVVYNGQSYTDNCLSNNTVAEYFCDNGKLNSASAGCPNGYSCTDGACIAPSKSCTDSDGGQNIYVKGIVTLGSQTYTDTCINSSTVYEYYCPSPTIYPNDPNLFEAYSTACPSGYACQDGACKFSTSQQCVINSFTADPPTVHWDSSSTSSTNFSILSWSASNCTSCHVTSGSVGYWPTNNSNSVTIYNIKNTTTFTLECSGPNNTVTKQLIIYVPPNEAPECLTNYDCTWCGNQCEPKKTIPVGTNCANVTPPSGATCACVNNTCTVQYSSTSLMDALNKLSASLISLIELLKR